MTKHCGWPGGCWFNTVDLSFSMNQTVYSAARSSLVLSWVAWVDREPHVPAPSLVPFLFQWAPVESSLLLSVTSPQPTFHWRRRQLAPFGLLCYDLAEGGNEMSPFLWKTQCLPSKETHSTEGWGEMKHYKQRKKKGRRVLSQFVDAKWNYFDRFNSPTLKDPEFLISDLKTRSFTHDLTNYTIHNALRLIRHLLTPCQNSSQALFWVGIFKLLSFLGYPLFWCILYWQYFSQSWKLSSAESMLL